MLIAHLFFLWIGPEVCTVLILKKILQLCMKLIATWFLKDFFCYFSFFFLLVWGDLVWRRVEHGYLADHCPFKKMFNIRVLQRVREITPHLQMFSKCLQSRVLEIQMVILRQKFCQVQISEIKHPCLSPLRKRIQNTKTGTKTQVILNLSQCIPLKYWKQQKLRKDRVCVLSEIPLKPNWQEPSQKNKD